MNHPSLLDVRTREEFVVGHPHGAVNIPLDELVNRLDEVSVLPQPIVVYCRSGNRSAFAAQILKQNGIKNVANGGSLQDVKIKYKL